MIKKLKDLEALCLTEEEWNDLSNGEKAWALSRIMIYMNNEDAYFESGWLYYWIDGETWEECMNDFESEDSYKDLEEAFITIYSDKEFHNDGLYSRKDIQKSIIKTAHYWDKRLKLKPIEILK